VKQPAIITGAERSRHVNYEADFVYLAAFLRHFVVNVPLLCCL